ncbi:MAG: hypothetical protein LUQ32_02330 [Methanomicrobiales archaeon]|nr:hypothetical protein [Methanomicrobiales archaeon]
MPGDDEGNFLGPQEPAGENPDRKGKTSFTYEQMGALLNGIAEKYESLSDRDPASQNEQMVKYLSSLKKVEESEAGPGGTWVHFTDGGWLFLDNHDYEATGPLAVGPPGSPPGPPPGGSPEDMKKKAEEIATLIQSLQQQGSSLTEEEMKKRSDQIAALVKSLTQGISNTPSPSPARPSPPVIMGNAANHHGVPGSRVACLYSALPSSAWITNVHRYLTDSIYDVQPVKFNVTVDNLMTLPRCAVFGLVSHGTMKFKEGKLNPPYVIYTATPRNEVNDQVFHDFYELGYVAYYKSRKKGVFYGITEKFVEKFWRFHDNAFVYLDTCYAMNPGTQAFRDALFLKNASVVTGWTWKSYDPIGDETASYLFDRLLGANDFEGERPVKVPKEQHRAPDNPRQRPFDWLTLMPDMAANFLGVATDTDNNTTTQIAFQAGVRGDFGLLRPSIEFVAVHENDKEHTLTIHGLFGSGKSVRKKRVILWNDTTRKADGTKKNPAILYEVPQGNIEINDEGNEIVCKKFPKNGNGHAGYVTVTINDLESNCVPLTGWEAKFTFTVNKPGTPAGSDQNIICRITWETLIRGDVHDRRDRPGQNNPYLIGKVFNDVADREKPARFSHDSTYKGKDYRIIWKGSGNIVPSADKKGVVAAAGTTHPYDTRHPRINLGMAVQVHCRVITDDGAIVLDAKDWPADASRLFEELPGGDILRSKIEWGKDFDIPGDSFSADIAYDPLDGSKKFPAKIAWEKMKAEYPPTKDIEG